MLAVNIVLALSRTAPRSWSIVIFSGSCRRYVREKTEEGMEKGRHTNDSHRVFRATGA